MMMIETRIHSPPNVHHQQRTPMTHTHANVRMKNIYIRNHVRVATGRRIKSQHSACANSYLPEARGTLIN